MHHKHEKLLSKILGIKFMSSSEKYLGTHLFVNRDKTKSFQFLIDKFYTRLGNSKKSSLNVAGRTVVTKHVLSSLAVYHMSCFPFPKKITSKIDSIQRSFWLSKKYSRHAVYFRSWGDIGKDKRCGRLGTRNTYATNKVFIAKLGWRIIQNPDHLVSNFLKDKYVINQNLLEIDKAANYNSWIWKDVVRIRTIKVNLLLKDQIMWAHTKDDSYTIKSAYKVYKNEISNGEKALFWKKFDDRLGQSLFVVNWPSLGAIVMWCIWKLRCDVVFSKVAIDIDKITLNSKRMINAYIAAPNKIQKTNMEVKILINLVDHFLFTDSSFKNFNMGIGMILCDNAGTIVQSRSDFGLISDAVVGETTALFFAISWAKEINFSKVLFIYDCLQVVDFVNGSSVCVEWRCKDILVDCKSLLLSNNNFKEKTLVERL
ncbi:uncharacterized protein LOC113351759 [Papaver somniferum]|uniref:uncharacterized protein LOC113351759 n=1 Tax=Papaver somniferum TaxID=3469 RepID=UPI000E70238F|nr:uncharacterized protein LOC113351759 [Papaver somniferum]